MVLYRSPMLRDTHLLKRPILRRDDGTVVVGLPAITREVEA